ncbi:MAG: molybdopterin-dependent oxidoreductase [Candidatus Sericytochromatia bacterium]|nr:molybdopterin-dependent oxidoreductase [Candidatus Sericytochromatia bacterium]
MTEQDDENNLVDEPTLSSSETINDEHSINKEMNRRLFVNLLTGSAVAISGLLSLKWILSSKNDEIPSLLRKNHDFNANLSKAYFKPDRLAPTFSENLIADPRANGDLGLKDDFAPNDWLLHLYGNNTHKIFTLNNLKKLPIIEMTTELKCIEGWSQIVKWKGVRLFDFLLKNQMLSNNPKYVSMETPDKEYYVGLDIESAIHPQTLLAFEMNNKPLTLEHGAPLRLVTPLKYGIKHIKRIGSITVTDNKPKDYWAEQGYDWYSGH